MTAIIVPERLQSQFPLLPRVQIPCIIHQTFKSRVLPPLWQDTPASWCRHHPTWTYMFWDDEANRRLVASKFPSFLASYDSYEYPIQRADAVRYMILYTYGGLYVDMDMAANRQVDDLFYGEADVYLLRSPNMEIMTNCLMGSKQGSHFWLHVIELMRERAIDPSILWATKHQTVMYSTGPGMLQDAFDNYQGREQLGELQRNPAITLSDPAQFLPFSDQL